MTARSAKELGPAVHDATFIASATAPSNVPGPAYAEVAFAGRSNVGKSSLLNVLAQRRGLVRTSSTPGCTRGLNFFRLKLEGAVLDAVDLPGYGFAKRSKDERLGWAPLIERYVATRSSLRAVVVIVDARRGVERDDRELLDFLEHHARPAIVVATKVDKLSASERLRAVAAIARSVGARVIGFSSETGEGRDLVWRRILEQAAPGALAVDAQRART